MKRFISLLNIVLVLSMLLAACGPRATEAPTPAPVPTLPPPELAEKEWSLVAEALQDTGETLYSIDPHDIGAAWELASTYHDAGAHLADSSAALTELGAEETAETVASMATQFRQAGNALAEEDFASVANALSDSVGSLEVLVDPVFETDVPALLEPVQNAIFTLDEQAGIAQSIADLSPWLAELEELLDFYDTHAPEELQELAWAFLEEVQDPEEQARFGLYNAEEVETLKNLSQLLTTPEFEEWVHMAKSDLSGWLNEASQETFVLQTAEMGHWLIETGNVMTILVSQARLGTPATRTSGRNSPTAKIVPLLASRSTLAASVAAQDKCPKVCINRKCTKQVAFTPGPLNPDQDRRMVRIVNAPRTTMPFGGVIIRRVLTGLKATWMQHQRVVVWVKVRWEHCELKRCWFSKCKRWVKHESAWREAKPPKDFTVPGLIGWQGRIQWDKRVTDVMAKAIDEEANRISPCPTPTPTPTPTITPTPTPSPTPTPTSMPEKVAIPTPTPTLTVTPMPTPTPTFTPAPTAKEYLEECNTYLEQGKQLLAEHATGGCEEGIRRLRLAIEKSTTALELESNNAEACLCRGRSRVALYGELHEAIEDLQCALDQGLEGDKRAEAERELAELRRRAEAPICVSMDPPIFAEKWKWKKGEPTNPGTTFSADSLTEIWARWELYNPCGEEGVVKWYHDGEHVCQHETGKLEGSYDRSGWTADEEWIELGLWCVAVYIFDTKMTEGCFTVE